MNKILDILLGLPGVIVFCLIVGFVVTQTSGTNPKTECEAAGGKYVQTMKSYHTCKMNVK